MFIFFLTSLLTGVLLVPSINNIVPFLSSQKILLLWIHIVLGFGMTIIFILYTIDHVVTNKKYLKVFLLKTITGLFQIFIGATIIISGFIIYLYGSEYITPWSELHFITSIVCLILYFIHARSKKLLTDKK